MAKVLVCRSASAVLWACSSASICGLIILNDRPAGGFDYVNG
jgi:hypothetical protein